MIYLIENYLYGRGHLVILTVCFLLLLWLILDSGALLKGGILEQLKHAGLDRD